MRKTNKRRKDERPFRKNIFIYIFISNVNNEILFHQGREAQHTLTHSLTHSETHTHTHRRKVISHGVEYTGAKTDSHWTQRGSRHFETTALPLQNALRQMEYPIERPLKSWRSSGCQQKT